MLDLQAVFLLQVVQQIVTDETTVQRVYGRGRRRRIEHDFTLDDFEVELRSRR